MFCRAVHSGSGWENLGESGSQKQHPFGLPNGRFANLGGFRSPTRETPIETTQLFAEAGMLGSTGRRTRIPSNHGNPRPSLEWHSIGHGCFQRCSQAASSNIVSIDVASHHLFLTTYVETLLIILCWLFCHLGSDLVQIDVTLQLPPVSHLRTRHQSLCEGAEFFDNRYFEISNNEAGSVQTT